MSKGQNIKLLLELDDLVNMGSKDSKRIDELRTILGIKESVAVKREFPEEKYFRMKAMGLNDTEAAFLLAISPIRVDDYRKENSEIIDAALVKYADHSIIQKYKRRIAKGIK